MLNDISSGGVIIALAILALFLMGVVLESARILATAAAMAMRGVARALGAILLVAVIFALLVIGFVR